MSVAAVLLVKNEVDIIGATLDWLSTQVDEIIFQDNASNDGTREIAEAHGVTLIDDDDPAYYQAKKTTALGQRARGSGHNWVLPCDADEIWHTGEIKRPIRSYLAGLGPEVQVVQAAMYHHFPTDDDDPAVENPVKRLKWRQRESGALPKVCARTAPDLKIGAGNHDAHYTSDRWARSVKGDLSIRHFSWRTPEQYLRKIRIGQAAYAATELPESVGEHWRSWADKPDEAILEWYDRWALHRSPHGNSELILDPAPVPEDLLED
jgi:glycosyltransferase involved in cell wall biosynthesis